MKERTKRSTTEEWRIIIRRRVVRMGAFEAGNGRRELKFPKEGRREMSTGRGSSRFSGPPRLHRG